MRQGFALRRVPTGSAYKMIWTATQRRNRKNSIPALRRRPLKSFYMHFRLKRNAAQILASYYKPTLMVACTRYLYTPAEAIMQVKI